MIRSVLALGLTAFAALAASAHAPKEPRSHVIEINERALVPEDGILLGNGDLSVSVYQTADRIVWRFGKGDVWDRRIDRSDDPKPANIAEVARGIRDEGWKCPPYGGPVEATRGTNNPQRMKEICQAVPPSYRERPYPCPKPVGELAMQLPQDQPGFTIKQSLDIERSMLNIVCEWTTGVRLRIECFVPPKVNVLVVRWRMEGWNASTATGNSTHPVWFSLYRWADPSPQEFGGWYYGWFRHNAFQVAAGLKATPLPPPQVLADGGFPFVEQSFPAELTFPDGFQCLMAPVSGTVVVENANTVSAREARLHLMPNNGALSGALLIGVATTSDEGGALATLKSMRDRYARTEMAADRLAADTRKAASEFWAKSSVEIDDPTVERMWYETVYARRCVNRPNRYPPGLFLPSTVEDYSHWHGDYHTNYNLQQPFWGDYAANHLDLGDAYFKAMEPIIEIGRKIAHDYYGAHGVFIQLSAYPMKMDDDPLGCVPMGRMAYMTGWCANQYWWRYLVTLDKEWLRTKGYPVIRDCALFYADFMKRGADGLYHVFPSNQGEDGFSGNPKDFTDRPQVMQHLRYCLRAAVEASRILSADADLRKIWKDRLDHCPGDDGGPPLALTGLDRECHDLNPPEFGYGRPPRPTDPNAKPWPPPGDGFHTWYFGQYPWAVLQRLRGGDFNPNVDYPMFREIVERWRRPGGLMTAMAIANYGHDGAWTESLGAAAALQEMMLQSWDGALRVFPAWPDAVGARFHSFRAEGAFLVSAAWRDGAVAELNIVSEKGATCVLYSPWPSGLHVCDEKGRDVSVVKDPFGRPCFATKVGGTYSITPNDK